MKEINIKKKDIFYSIKINNKNITSDRICDSCGEQNLDFGYTVIIERLKKKGLIPQDQPLLCCMCGHFYKTRGVLPTCPNNPAHNVHTVSVLDNGKYEIRCEICRIRILE